uniref:Uncharacterized protein LOC113792116 n=1 Tax=Dermatophagoides pteronyssinus TaxID=6956 RepID=A0A6P6Y0N2_DERPT|nr:uncharacterized protein LOC113792116 [Dermatophagoides pteronyssinus]
MIRSIIISPNSLVILIAIIILSLITIIQCHRIENFLNYRMERSSNALKFIPRSSNIDDNNDDDDDDPFRLDRNIAIACTNRYNCERTCMQAKSAKQTTKASLMDALTHSIGESTMTDAHKLGIQFGRHKSCDKCSLIYSNCMDDWYRIARRQLFHYRSQDGSMPMTNANDDSILLPSSHKISNRL